MYHDEKQVAEFVRRARPECPVPVEHRGELRRQVLEEFQRTLAKERSKAAAASSHRPGLRQTVRRHGRGIAISVAAMMLLGIGLYWLISPSMESGQAFADIRRQLLQAEAVRFEMTTTIRSDDGQRTISGTVTYRRPEQVRIDLPDGDAMVLDLEDNKAMLVDRETKTATIVYLDSMGDRHRLPESLARQVPLMLSGTGDNIGSRQIGETAANGYRVTADNVRSDFWVDPEQRRIVRVVSGLQHPEHSISVVYSNFDLTPKLDPSSMTLTPPAGYAVRHRTLSGMVKHAVAEMMTFTEADILETLEEMARRNDGQFPSARSVNKFGVFPLHREDYSTSIPILIGAIARTLDQLRGPATIHGALLQQAEPGSWQYVGRDVPLGSRRPIAWYRRADNGKYRVIMGDLTVQQVPGENGEIHINPESLPLPTRP
ncbi:MAG: LolA family protein [Phycisphaerae bacterium]